MLPLNMTDILNAMEADQPVERLQPLRECGSGTKCIVANLALPVFFRQNKL